MKAKDKAKELFNKYCFAIRTEQTDSGYFTNVIYAKDCALIAVDEIINVVKKSIEDYDKTSQLVSVFKNKESFNLNLEHIKKELNIYGTNSLCYWISVKNEINKL